MKDCSQAWFVEGESETYQLNLAGTLTVQYIDSTVINGDTFKDTLSINGVEIQNANLGLARTVNTLMDDIVVVTGLGFDNSVATSYPSIISNMLAENIIANPVYSPWLSQYGENGSKYFGGTEPGKLVGPSVTLNMVPKNGVYTCLEVAY